MSEKEQNYLLPFCMHELLNFLVATGFCFCVGARHVLFVVACFSSLGKMDAVSFFLSGHPMMKKLLVNLLFSGFWDDRNEYPRASNFLGFMSIICTILKKNMFSDKKYI